MSTTTSTSTSSDLSQSEVISLICNFLAYFIGLGTTSLLTNYLLPVEYSRVVLGIYSVTLLYPLVMRGGNQSIFTYLGQYLKQEDTDSTTAFLAWDLKVLVYGIIVYLFLVISVSLAIYYFDYTYFADSYKVIFAFLCLAPLWAFMSIQGKVLLSLKQYRAYFTCNVISQPFWLLVFLAFYVWQHDALTYRHVIYAYYASYIITIVGLAVWLNVQPNTQSFKTLWQTALSSSLVSEWRKYSFELFINLEISTLQGTVGVYILEIFSGDKTAAGMYAVVTNIAKLYSMVNSALATIITPLISGNVTTSDGQATLQKTINSINVWQIVAGGLIYVATILFAKPILSMFGSHYEQAATILKIYCTFEFLLMFNTNGLVILNYAGDVTKSIILNISILVLILIFGSVAAYFYQLNGFLIAASMSFFVVYLVACGIVRSDYNLKVLSIF